MGFGGQDPIVMGDLNGRETGPSKPITGIEWSHSLRGRYGGRGREMSPVRGVDGDAAVEIAGEEGPK